MKRLDCGTALLKGMVVCGARLALLRQVVMGSVSKFVRSVNECMAGQQYLLPKRRSLRFVHNMSGALVPVLHGISGEPVDGLAGVLRVLNCGVLEQDLELFGC